MECKYLITTRFCSGNIEVLKQVTLMTAPDESTKDKMEIIASPLLSNRKIGEAAALYKLLPKRSCY